MTNLLKTQGKMEVLSEKLEVLSGEDAKRRHGPAFHDVACNGNKKIYKI